MMRSRRLQLYAIVAFATLCAGAGGGPVDGKVIGTIALVLVAARAMAFAFESMGQPAVLGELVAGVIIGNLDLFGFTLFEFISTDPSFALLAELGVILLLFEVGLESNLGEMAKSGPSAAGVAIVGVVLPVGLGYGAHALIASDATWHTHLFVGAILAATSVGITARVLQELGKIATPTGRIILGAAVIDDVLGLVVLSVVQGIVHAANEGESLDVLNIVQTAGWALGFLFFAILLGQPASRVLFKLATKLRTRGVLLAVSLAFCLLLAYAAQAVKLHAIVGAFAAGLVLDGVVYKDLESQEPHGLEEMIQQLAAFLVPIFFVVTGTKVELDALQDGNTLVLAGLLTLAAIVGKQICSVFAFGKGVNRLAVGLGMIPRGEVGLIFAGVGLTTLLNGEPILSPSTYAAAIVMIMITTMVTPPILAWSLNREGK